MGTLYTPIPLSVLSLQAETRAYLEQQGVRLPPPAASSRYPTPNEIRNAVESIPESEAEYDIGPDQWRVTVSMNESPAWTSVVVMDYLHALGEDDEPHDFYFEKGWPELVEDILQRLSLVCGPFVLFANGEAPRLVSADDPFDQRG